jgi:hypothetical protein
VKAAAVIALILVVAIVVLLVTGTHGPGRHSQTTGVRGDVG